MNRESKIELAKAQSLMERMDKHYGKQDAMLLESSKINEAVGKKRIQVTRDQILDVLDNMDENGRGRFTSFTYVKPISFYKTKKNWKPDEMISALSNHNDMADTDWHKQLSDFNGENTSLKKNPISAIVVAQKYSVHWTSPEKYGEAYSKYNNDLSNLRMRFGAPSVNNGVFGDNHNQREKSDTGAQFNQTGNLSRDMNLVDSHVKTTNYVIGETGNIISEIPGDIVKAMTTPKKKYEIEASMAEILQDNPEKIAEYKAEKAKLDAAFRGQNFLMDRILTIVASVGGVDYYYINDKLGTAIADKSDVMVSQEDFKKIAIEQLNQTFYEISSEEFAN